MLLKPTRKTVQCRAKSAAIAVRACQEADFSAVSVPFKWHPTLVVFFKRNQQKFWHHPKFRIWVNTAWEVSCLHLLLCCELQWKCWVIHWVIFLYFPLSTETTDCSDQDGVEGAFPLHPSPDVLGTFWPAGKVEMLCFAVLNVPCCYKFWRHCI